MLTTRPVLAAATSRSVCRQRNAGICRTSATSAAAAACDGSWMSVTIGTLNRALDRAEDAQALASAGSAERAARRAVGLVVRRLEDERDAARASVMSTSALGETVACCSLSMTHGPAMSTNGCRRQWRCRQLNGSHAFIIRGEMALSEPLVGRRRSASTCSCHAVSALGRLARLSPCRLVLVARFDEGREQRMRAGRLRLELGVELHGHVPRMARQLRRSRRTCRRASGRRFAGPCSMSVCSYRQLNSYRWR